MIQGLASATPYATENKLYNRQFADRFGSGGAPGPGTMIGGMPNQADLDRGGGGGPSGQGPNPGASGGGGMSGSGTGVGQYGGGLK